MAPTTAATALMAVTWKMGATTAPGDADKATLKTELATQLGVDPLTGMKNFDVTSQAVARRLKSDKVAGDILTEQKGRELTTYEWTVFFDLVSTSDAAASTALAAVASLEDPDFEAEIKTSIPAVQAFEAPVTTHTDLGGVTVPR